MSPLISAIAIIAFSGYCQAGPVPVRQVFGPAPAPVRQVYGPAPVPVRQVYGSAPVPVRQVYGPAAVPVGQVYGPAPVPVRQVNGPVAFAPPIEQLSFKPYEFGYELGDGQGMTQHRREIADGTGAVKGSYGYQDLFGVNRVVEYTADSDGYKAIVHTNEPGVVGQNPAHATYLVRPPPAAAVAQGLRRPVLIQAV